MSKHLITLSRKIREDERRHPEATGAFSNLLEHIAIAAKVISREVNKAGLADICGFTGETNVQGEEVRKLDAFANETLVGVLGQSGFLAAMASEEDEEIIECASDAGPGSYIVLFDPLDGSSNIDANVSIGTIFSILRRPGIGAPAREEEFLQEGHRQVAAGYVIYGSSTMLVYTTGHGVHGFTLDASVGEFLLSHPDIRTPPRGKIFSMNTGNVGRLDEGVASYLRFITAENRAEGRPYSLRYIGSLVADFHRNLLYGGIFLYPADRKCPRGKLRLLYEANPLAMIVEEAGGKASTGWERILDVEPGSLHQRVPLIIGSRDDVEEAEAFIQGRLGAGALVADALADGALTDDALADDASEPAAQLASRREAT